MGFAKCCLSKRGSENFPSSSPETIRDRASPPRMIARAEKSGKQCECAHMCMQKGRGSGQINRVEGEGGNLILARLNIGREGLFSKLGGGGEGGRV